MKDQVLIEIESRDNEPVSRKEYNKLLRKVALLEEEIKQLKRSHNPLNNLGENIKIISDFEKSRGLI